MNRYESIIAEEDGTVWGMEVWADSFEVAEKIVIYTWVPVYFENKEIYPTNLYSVQVREIKRNRTEFILSIHDKPEDLCEPALFLISIKRCKDLKLIRKV